jgi:hypothetical protein
MPGLVPGIRVYCAASKNVDGRDELENEYESYRQCGVFD